MGVTLVLTGNFAEGRVHLDQVIALYDPVEHRPLATRVGVDPRVAALVYRSLALWALGYPEAAFVGTEQALREAQHVGALMQALAVTCVIQLIASNYAIAKAKSDELIALAEEKGSDFYNPIGMLRRASLFALTVKASDASRHLHLVDPRMALDGISTLCPRTSIPFGEGLWGAWAI